jgi:transcriptional regulator with GAF, ATPase, and Fis domain
MPESAIGLSAGFVEGEPLQPTATKTSTKKSGKRVTRGNYHIALVRVWLKNGVGSLELMASAGTPSGGGSYTRLDGEFREMAVADSRVACIADAREPFIVRGIRGDEDWLTNPGWVARQSVRAFIGVPIVEDGEAIGVLAAFDREMPSDEQLANIQLAVDLAASRVVDLSARAIPPPVPPPPITIVTRAEVRRLERANIEAALAATRGKIFGDDGAARLLGMRPTTLASRIKALGIFRR